MLAYSSPAFPTCMFIHMQTYIHILHILTKMESCCFVTFLSKCFEYLSMLTHVSFRATLLLSFINIPKFNQSTVVDI